MDRETLRRTAQIVLLVVAVAAGGFAGYRYISTRDTASEPQAAGVSITPTSGPVGMRPFIEVSGFERGTTVEVRFCRSGTDACVALTSVDVTARVRSEPIPRTLPDGTAVEPGTYEIRSVPASEETVSFEVVPFGIGEQPEPRDYSSVDPRGLTLADPREVARGAPCGVHFMPDGRLAIGPTVLDPATGVTIETGLRASELRWSPTGERLAIVTDDRKEIRLAEPGGDGATTVVREARGLLSSVAWAPEGDRIAYSARSEPGVGGGPGAPAIFVFSLVTGESGTIGPGERVAWGPDGRLAVEVAGGSIELADDQGTRQRLTDGRFPAFTPDGSILVFIRTEDGEPGPVWATRLDEPEPVRWTDAAYCGVDVAPDGGRLALGTATEGEDAAVALRQIFLPS